MRAERVELILTEKDHPDLAGYRQISRHYIQPGETWTIIQVKEPRKDPSPISRYEIREVLVEFHGAGGELTGRPTVFLERVRTGDEYAPRTLEEITQLCRDANTRQRHTEAGAWRPSSLDPSLQIFDDRQSEREVTPLNLEAESLAAEIGRLDTEIRAKDGEIRLLDSKIWAREKDHDLASKETARKWVTDLERLKRQKLALEAARRKASSRYRRLSDLEWLDGRIDILEHLLNELKQRFEISDANKISQIVNLSYDIGYKSASYYIEEYFGDEIESETLRKTRSGGFVRKLQADEWLKYAKEIVADAPCIKPTELYRQVAAHFRVEEDTVRKSLDKKRKSRELRLARDLEK